MSIKKPYLLITLILLLSGCAHITESGYYWGNYSQTYYQYIKAPSDVTVTNHLNELNRIVSKSQELGLKVPPGIYAEIGFITAKRGKPEEALSFYQQEMTLYPESQAFLERLTKEHGDK